MQKLLSLAFVAFVVVVGARWAMIAFDDAALSNEMTGVPGSIASRENHAAAIASLIETRAQQAHCAVIEDGIKVDLSGVEVRGKPPNEQFWQKVDLNLKCKRKNALFILRTVELKASMDMMVQGGHEEHFPR